MKLVFVNSAWTESWGGGEKWTVEAAQWFGEHGHKIIVVGRPNSRLLKAAITRGHRVIETTFGGDFDPAAILRGRKILRGFRPDLVVVNFNKEAWQFGLAAKSLGIRVVARHGFPLFRKRIHHRVLATSVLDKLVVNAASIREYYRALGIPVDGIEIIHNGTAILESKHGELRKRFGIRDEELLVVAAGRLESQKRFDRIAEIASALIPQFGNLRFLIAGDGPLAAELQADIRTRKIAGRVQLAGFQPDFAEIAGDADLFLLTSDEEGTPNVLLEAMAADVACVSFAVGAVPEILGGSLAANVIAPGDVAAMTERAAMLLWDEELRTRTAEEMKAHARREFSLDASMTHFQDVFQQTIGNTR